MRIQNSKIKAQNPKLWTVGLITLVLALMLLTEPVLSAGKGGGGGGGGRGGGGDGGGSQKSQQAQPSSSAPRVQPSPSVSTAPSRVTAPAPSARTESRLGTSSPPSLNSPPTTFRSSSRQPDRMVIGSPSAPVSPAPQPRPVTSSPQSSSTGGSRSIIREQPTISSSVRTSSVGSSTTEANPSGTPSTSRETNQINPERTHRIGSSIGKEVLPVPTVEKQPSVSSDSRGGRGRTGRGDSSVSEKKPSVAATEKPPVISLSKTSRIGSPIGKEKGGHKDGKSASSGSKGPSNSVNTERTGPVNSSMGTEQPSISSMDSQGDTSRGSHADSRRISRTDESAADKKLPLFNTIKGGQRGGHKADTPEKIQETQDARYKTQDARQGPGQKDRKPAGSRLSKRASENQKAVIDKFDGDKTRIRHSERVGSSRVVYDDCPELISHSRHHEQIYIDRHKQVCHRTIWPEYYFPVYYDCGPCWTFRYVYPYYHRRYVFVSLGGYWPVEYTCVRYYWYGCHPYIWSGYYPIPYEVQGNTYNYYTYNYYTYNYPGTEAGTTASAEPGQTTNYIRPVDENTFADVREKLAKQQAAKPGQETPADAYFEEAVKAFEINDYSTAIEKFAKAIEFAPDDMILPFAYTQALLADERYIEAAGVLRAALAKVSPEKGEVFYPRGLYPSDDILFEQIDRLDEKAKLYSFDADLQLLVGYQLLGIGEIDEAVEPLRLASRDLENAAAATVLLNLLEKVRANSTSQNTD